MQRLPITDPADLDALRVAGWLADDQVAAGEAVELVRAGPDPSGALRRIAALARRTPHLVRRAAAEEPLRRRLTALAGGSRALMGALTRSRDPAAVLERGAGSFDPADPARLATAVRESLATIAAADLADEIDMPVAARLVSEVADRAARLALEGAGVGNATIAVIAMGKWGGCELNYASDIDLVLVHHGDEETAIDAAGRFVETLRRRDGDGGAYRVDTALRPEGARGPLSRSLDSYRAYWERWAETWELQALLKARFVAGDPDLGARFLAVAADFVFPQRLGADAVRSVRAMKARSEQLLAADVTELKRGVGGIRDVEFAVQLLQLVHGRADPGIRSANTLEALESLGHGGYVLPDDASALASAYRHLRDTEHRLQLFDLRQTHTLPEDPVRRERIARALGYRDRPAATALQRFEADLAAWRLEVRSIHERLFHRPVLEALAESRAGAMTVEAAVTRLTAFGFLDTDATRAAVSELTSGLSRRSGLMRHMLPLVMEWLSLSPDPDLGLAQLRRLVDESADTSALVATLRDDPVAAERLCTILGTSRLVARLLDRLPPLVPRFGDDGALSAWPGREQLTSEALRRVEVRPDPAGPLHAFYAEHLLEIAVADLVGLIDEVEVGRRLSDLADATVHSALRSARLPGDADRPIGIVALGKWGGRELNYASDLDAVVVVPDASHVEGASGVIERLISILGAGRIGFRSLELDLDLRPEGKKGSLVRSLDGYRAYWAQWAATWELQAMLRARAAAGDPAVGSALVDAAAEPVHAPRRDLLKDVRSMKARVESERIPLGDDPDFHLKLGHGGLADVEWTVQLLQMIHGGSQPGVRGPSTLGALARLAAQGLIPHDEAAVLDEAYRFCVRVRNHLFLQVGRVGDSLPTEPIETARLARSLGYTENPRTSLREDYRRVTRRARRVVERRFYGLGPQGDGRSA